MAEYGFFASILDNILFDGKPPSLLALYCIYGISLTSGILEAELDPPYVFGVYPPLPPLPTPPQRRDRSILQQPLLPRAPHLSRPPQRLPLNSPPLSSLHTRPGVPSIGRRQYPLPDPSSRLHYDPPSATPLSSRPSPSLDTRRDNSRPSTFQTLPTLPTTPNGPRSSQGDSLLNRPTWDLIFLTEAGIAPPRDPESDYVQALVDGTFSSPSIPPQSPHSEQYFSTSAESSPGPSGSSIIPDISGHGEPTTMPTTRERKRRSSDVIEVASLSTSDPTPKRRRSPGGTARAPEEGGQAKRSRASAAKLESEFDDDVFFDRDEEDIINLEDADERPREKSEPEVDRHSIKLGTFQCVICMDDATHLTVTHCG